MKKTAPIIIASGLLVFMSWIVISTSLQDSLLDKGVRDYLASIPWMRATLWDFYGNVLVIFCFVAWRERSLAVKLLWLVIFILLGSIGSFLYIIVELLRLPSGAPASAIFERKRA